MKGIINKIPLGIILICILLVSSADAINETDAAALKQLADSITADFPDDIAAARIAVFPFAGDREGAVRSAVERAFVRDSMFIVLERQNLDQILAEEEFIVRPDINPASIVNIAGKLGAEAVVLGDVRWKSEWGVSEISLSLRLVDMETLAILWAGDYQGRDSTPLGEVKYLILIFGGLIIVIFVIIIRRFKIDISDLLTKAETVRESAIKSLQTAVKDLEHLLFGIKTEFDESVKTLINQRKREIEESVQGLKAVSFGIAESTSYKQAQSKLEQARRIEKRVTKVREQTAEIRDKVTGGETDISGQLKQLGSLISDARQGM